jgi:hypothetical protein
MPSSNVPVSALVPMLNEELNISACLESLRFCDEVWVVDSHSRDRSAEIAALPFKHPWVLIVDCDERVPPELAEDIRSAIERPGDCTGFYLNRRVFFLGRWLRHCWYPSWNMRLFLHEKGRYERLESGYLETGDNEVHEHVLLQGKAGSLQHDLLHYDYRSLHHFIERHNRYSTWEAEHRLREQAGRTEGLQASLRGDPLQRRRWWKRLFLRVPGKPVWRFLYTYLWRRGFLDGYSGFLISAYMAIYEFEIAMKMYERRQLERHTRA